MEQVISKFEEIFKSKYAAHTTLFVRADWHGELPSEFVERVLAVTSQDEARLLFTRLCCDYSSCDFAATAAAMLGCDNGRWIYMCETVFEYTLMSYLMMDSFTSPYGAKRDIDRVVIYDGERNLDHTPSDMGYTRRAFPFDQFKWRHQVNEYTAEYRQMFVDTLRDIIKVDQMHRQTIPLRHKSLRATLDYIQGIPESPATDAVMTALRFALNYLAPSYKPVKMITL